MRPQSYTLHFNAKLSLNAAEKHVRDGLSTALCTGENLWLSCDERTSIERLRRTGPLEFGQHTSYRLTELLDLPADAESEIDVEGLAATDHYLWVIGSHSLKRKQPDAEHEDVSKQLAKLAKVQADPNRYLLARIPLLLNEATGDYELHKSAAHPTKANEQLHAAQLHGNAETNELLDLLAHDPHLQPFMALPGKDNGFDIEGLAATTDGRLFVGLRGPVLRGWAIVLELLPELDKHGRLRLGKIGGEQKYYKKHFLDLGGMGLRELRLAGDDLYLLAGPTMDLDGTIAVYCWPNALNQPGDTLNGADKIHRYFDVPHGHGPTSGQDKAEGMALLDDKRLLIVFDSPTAARKPAAQVVLADAFRLPK
ncbi:Protein of unknown function [Hymenobacter daecheongensis DSM 21074]|uniref:DUF3616 domain-containing protein n=1 Tax=Hymenobacter daecheongensis DSM 21074 TaxID=1121955 RepID=A0A1M6J9J4_9BACT|nr:DUF3616 domain-containing protein [Hymenobacter daecheongensis]SHJ43387.1 Protein of unknown function [Hymenobacter daecheongensis DSM 21074]